jgi:hypothetical protein
VCVCVTSINQKTRDKSETMKQHFFIELKKKAFEGIVKKQRVNECWFEAKIRKGKNNSFLMGNINEYSMMCVKNWNCWMAVSLSAGG